MVRRLTITLSEEERNALRVMADKEMRPLRDHVHWLLVQEVQRRGLLPNESPAETSAAGSASSMERRLITSAAAG